MSAAVVGALGLIACASQQGDSEGTAEAQATASRPVCTSSGICPQSFADLTNLKSADLRELFDKGSMGNVVFDGLYSGLPLCFPREMPPASAFPAGARAETGFDQLVGAFRLLTNNQMNRVAGFIWHGKKFDRHTEDSVSQLLSDRAGNYLFVGDVINNIGRTDIDFSAEASLLLDRPHNSIDLDYSLARTGLQLPGNIPIPGVSKITVPIIRHVWDRVRLVNPDKKLYVGEAYIVDQPGVYDDRAVPLCFFALTPKSTGNEDPRPETSPGSPSDPAPSQGPDPVVAPDAADAGAPNAAADAAAPNAAADSGS